MSRPPLDAVPQELLVIELRHAIDRVRRRPYHTPSVDHLRDLLAANPRSAASTHVTYNLGKERCHWLQTHDPRMGAGPFQVDATRPRSSTQGEKP